MEMDNAEIIHSYNNAVDKKAQGGILAELNNVGVWVMRNKLIELGCTVDGRWFQDKNPARIPHNRKTDIMEENANLMDEVNDLKEDLDYLKKDLALSRQNNAVLEKENETLKKLCQGLQNGPHFEERDAVFVIIIGQVIGALHMVSRQLGPRDGCDYLKELAEMLHVYAAGGEKNA